MYLYFVITVFDETVYEIKPTYIDFGQRLNKLNPLYTVVVLNF